MKGLPSGRIAALGLSLILVFVGAIFVFAGAGDVVARDMQFAQASPDAGVTTGTAPALQGIGLTVSHKRIIYENIGGERVQALSDAQKPTVGGTIPDSVMLNEMPIAVKDQVGVLRDFKFARLPGDNIVIVDPVSRKVVDIVTREEAGR